MKVNKNRVKLLLELERIVGDECYNANIQNWGPNGTFEGEGRSFTYPITFGAGEEKVKGRWRAADMPPEQVMSGYYAFGANQLHIIRALNKVLDHLEQTGKLTL